MYVDKGACVSSRTWEKKRLLPRARGELLYELLTYCMLYMILLGITWYSCSGEFKKEIQQGLLVINSYSSMITRIYCHIRVLSDKTT